MRDLRKVLRLVCRYIELFILLLLILLQNVTVDIVIAIDARKFLMLIILLLKLCWKNCVWIAGLILARFQWLYRLP